jgi:hypothetical protein
MDLLKKAEQLDGYQKEWNKSLLNRKARQGLLYEPFFSQETPGPGDSVLITMHPTAEAGLPHTRPPNLICIPAYYPENRLDNLIRHELIHIDQRKRPGVWRERFLREGWSPVSDNNIPDIYKERIRLNPDTLHDGYWAWKGVYVPLPLFERTDKPDLRQTQIRWWNRETGSLLAEPPMSFQKVFGYHHPQAEHPREISAVLLAEKPGNLDKIIKEYLDS